MTSASRKGTAAAVDLIPKDIIICPWHYELRESYLSILMFVEKGFRVLPAGWKNVDAIRALIQFSRAHAGPKLLGHMFTTWGLKKEDLLQFPPLFAIELQLFFPKNSKTIRVLWLPRVHCCSRVRPDYITHS